MKTFYFNTGVKPWYPGPPSGVLIRGEWHIPFDCEDVPDNAIFQYACTDAEKEKNNPDFIVRKIHNSAICSEYAVFLDVNRWLNTSSGVES